MSKELQINKVNEHRTGFCRPVSRAMAGFGLLLALQPGTAWAGPSFQPVILDNHYIAYERDVGDIDGDGDNDLVTIQEGDTTLQVFRAPTWTRSTLITFTGNFRFPRADDFKLADMGGDPDLILNEFDHPCSHPVCGNLCFANAASL